MSRVTTLLNRIRTDLGDSSSQRYTDSMLLGYLNEAASDFNIATKFLTDRLYMGLNKQSAIYDVGLYALQILRAEYLNIKIEAKSMDDMDRLEPSWQSTIGTEVKYIVFDRHRKGRFRVYPRVEGSLDIVNQNSPYGGLIDITIGDDDFQIPSLEDVEADLDKFLCLYIVKKPLTITINTTDDQYEFPAEFDSCFIHYVKYCCLRSDTDINNRNYGNEEYQLYLSYIASIQGEEAIDNNKVDIRTTDYNGGFD